MKKTKKAGEKYSMKKKTLEFWPWKINVTPTQNIQIYA